MGAKSKANDFLGRFREIVSDPLNVAIRRDPRAGFVDGNYIYLHNGLKVPVSGPHAYYGEFSSILAINRGVHEPLEEYVFQQLIKRLPASPSMLELGAYWGHYSMWLKVAYPDATVILVEPELQNLNAGKHNFEVNGLIGEFIHAFVSKDQFKVDKYILENKIQKIDILHSDIQGYEVEMLENCSDSLEKQRIDYLFISTHSQQLHYHIKDRLVSFNYRVEISADFDFETTSFDGFIFASSPSKERVFGEFTPLSRVQIERAQPELLIEYLSNIIKRTNRD
ncbi:FkbM family methyltransferase [Methylomonas sp. MgM2]